jgi:hypothetical protein
MLGIRVMDNGLFALADAIVIEFTVCLVVCVI